MLIRGYRAYHDWMISGMRAFRERRINKIVARGRLTEEMASNRRVFSELFLRIWPLQAAFTLIYIIYVVSQLARLIPPSGIASLVLGIAMLAYAIYIFPKSLHHSRIERSLRRKAILDGRLKAHFPDRIWARSQRKADLA